MRIVKEAAERRNEILDVAERLTKTVLAANVDTKTGDMILEQVHKPQNALMHVFYRK